MYRTLRNIITGSFFFALCLLPFGLSARDGGHGGMGGRGSSNVGGGWSGIRDRGGMGMYANRGWQGNRGWYGDRGFRNGYYGNGVGLYVGQPYISGSYGYYDPYYNDDYYAVNPYGYGYYGDNYFVG